MNLSSATTAIGTMTIFPVLPSFMAMRMKIVKMMMAIINQMSIIIATTT